MNQSALTIADIRLVSKVTTHLLSAAGLSCCLVGSSAGFEHGITRTPNDVDVLVMTDKPPDELKNYLVSADPSFCWKKPISNPQAIYRVLWYQFPLPEATEVSEKSCRVDLFIPGMIHLPQIPSDKIIYSDSKLPIMPFFPVVLHKIQAWKAHMASTKPWVTIKQENDISDINDLLAVAATAGQNLGNQIWLEQWFLAEAIEGVQEYVESHPETARGWRDLGFLKDPTP